MRPTLPISVIAPLFMLALASIALSACGSTDRALPIHPSDASRINVSVLRADFTQAAQAEHGSLPMVAGTAAALNVVVLRSVETVVEAPLVLRLFRVGNVVFTDTAFTGGVLGPAIPRAGANAQFLIPDSLVAPEVSWQVELDPLRTQPDSTRADNVLPRGAPASLVTVAVQPLRLRLVPVILSRHNDLDWECLSRERRAVCQTRPAAFSSGR